MADESRGKEAPLFTVVAAIIQRGGRVLICQRRRNDSFGLKWEFPGGKVQAGETPAEALARELEEELGVRARIGAEICRVRHKYAEHAREIKLLFLTAHLESAEVRNLAFEKIVWEEAARLPAYDFLAADREIVERLAKAELKL
ncbi:MAG: NUDIX domain-containing protein [Acidobacteria bacterium]|nr:NUDIX domain-containing protein [Acidobacteriota bacterium]MCL5288864.1 NUDIX domain-containing protein [Acidobacteriota bacterium]